MPLGAVIGLPCWETWNWRFSMCLQSLAPPMNYQTKTVPVVGKQIDVARNEIVECALRDGAEHVLFLDTDVIFPPHSFQQLLLRQRNNPEHKITSGVYWSKGNPCFPLIFHEAGRGSFLDWRMGDYIKADYAIGMGLVLIHTDVLRAIEPPWFRVNYGLNTDAETGLSMSASITEDLYFCEKATAAGLELWVDTGIQAGHLDGPSGVIFGLNDGMPQAQGRSPNRNKVLYIGDILAGGEPSDVLSMNASLNPTWVAPPEKVPANGPYEKVCIKDVDILPQSLPEAAGEWFRVLKSGGVLEVIHPDFVKWLAKGVPIIRRATYGLELYEQVLPLAGFTDVLTEERGDYRFLKCYKPQDAHPLVSIIVVAHDMAEMTANCIKSIRERTTTENYRFEIIVVDNGSETPLPLLGDRQVRLADNLPYGAAVTAGIGVADKAVPYLLLLNNDTVIIQGEWLTNLLTRLRGQYIYAAVGPKQITPIGTIYHTEIGFDDNRVPYHLWLGFAHDRPEVQTEKDVLALNFGCVLLRRELFEKVGGFDRQFDMAGNYEDIDLCLRLRQAGHKLMFTPSSNIIHAGAQTLAQDKKRSDESIRVNRERFVNKWKDAEPELFGEEGGE